MEESATYSPRTQAMLACIRDQRARQHYRLEQERGRTSDAQSYMVQPTLMFVLHVRTHDTFASPDKIGDKQIWTWRPDVHLD